MSLPHSDIDALLLPNWRLSKVGPSYRSLLSKRGARQQHPKERNDTPPVPRLAPHIGGCRLAARSPMVPGAWTSAERRSQRVVIQGAAVESFTLDKDLPYGMAAICWLNGCYAAHNFRRLSEQVTIVWLLYLNADETYHCPSTHSQSRECANMCLIPCAAPPVALRLRHRIAWSTRRR